jgi:NTE family protein
MSTQRDIALALSGGGYRAAYFQLGVLEKLHELNLLDRVGVISSVSGGSILAGIYATALLHDEPFASFKVRALRFLNQFVPLDGLAMLHDVFPWSRSSKGLEKRFRKHYRLNAQPIMMKDLKDLSPKFVFNATAVHSGAGWRFIAGGTADHWELGHTHSKAFTTRSFGYECNVTLAKAVAASSAFPTFAAVTIPLKEIKQIDPGTSPASPDDKEIEGIIPPFPSQLTDPLCLSDGGVLDNIGVTSIIADEPPPEAPHNYYLIASDAGAVVDRLKSPPRGRLRKIHYLMRQFEMRGHHNNQMTSFLALRYHRREIPEKGLAKLNMNEAVPHAGENLDQVEKLTSIPTRLKRLPDSTSRDLIRHGSNLLWTRVSEYMSELLPPERLMPGTDKKQAAAS